MSISALSRPVAAAELPLERLATSTQVSDREKVAEVSRQFEAVLLRQILSQAQKPLLKGESPMSSTGNAIYQDMITHQLADRISHGGSFGFAKVLEKQLSAQILKKEAPAAKTPAIAASKQTPLEPEAKPHLHTTEKVEPPKTPKTPAIHRLRAQPGKRI